MNYEDKIREIVDALEEHILLSGLDDDKPGKDEAVSALRRLMVEAIDYVDGGGVIAKRASFQPHGHDPIISWPIIQEEVLIVPLQQRKDHLAELNKELE